MSTATPLASVPAGSELRPVPGDNGLPLIGHTLTALHDPIGFLRERYDRHGPVSWSRQFGIPMVQMIGPDANQFVFRNKGDLFSNNQGWDFFIGKFFYRGIMLLDFEEHRWHRKIMQQAFNRDVLREYIDRMGPAIHDGITEWKGGEGFSILKNIKQLTLDLATDVFMGYELGPEADRINRAFIDAVRGGTAIIRHPVPGLRWQRGLRGRRILEKFFYSQIASKRNSDENDMFSVLCRAETEDGERFSDEDVVNHMIFLMMAAHDTSTITLSNMCYYLAKYPEWQERVREECRSLDKDIIDYDDLEKLPTIGLVMKEALRMCAPVPAIPRKTVQDVEYEGYWIPKGTMISVQPFFTHYMHEYWSDPFRFDPERFAEHRREDKVHPYAWVPFGGGAHKCIGLHFAEMQIKAILHQLVLHYRWSVEPGYEMRVDTTTLPVPADGLPVKLERV